MKKITLFFALVLSFNLFAQTLEVPQQKKALLFKGTASWCGPCGYYHYVTDEIYSNHSDSILFLNGHVATSDVGDPYSGDMHNLLNGGGGIPSFSLSGVELADWPPTVDMIMNEADNFFGTSVTANIAYYYDIVDGQIEIYTTTKFFEECTADNYYVGAMVVENNIMVSQKVDEVYEDMLQHRIQRTVAGTLINLGSGKKLWADEIATGTVPAGSTFDLHLSKTLNTAWNVDELEVIVVIWKRVGDSFIALSAEDVPLYGVGIDEQETQSVSVYPNPADEYFSVSCADVEINTITFTDLSGKTVLVASPASMNATIDVSGMNPGFYLVTIETNQTKTVKRIIVR